MEKRSKRNLLEELTKIISESLKNNVFSGCSIGYLNFEKDKAYQHTHHFGCTDRHEEGRRVDKATIYDLASLTKPLVTALSVMTLVEKGKLRLEDELGKYFNDIRSEIGMIRLSMLLSHSSGLPAHKPYYKVLSECQQSDRNEAIVRLICSENLVFQPGSNTLYSDLGFILLGCLLEKITKKSLADFWQEEIAQPMGLQKKLFFPGPGGLGSEVYAVTGVCNWSGKRLCGIVHDDNCRMLGGVAGHAGLFGTASGVLSLLENLLLQYRGIKKHPAYGADILREFLTKRSGSTWTYGFDTPSLGTSSSGRLFSTTTVGHLGFTGTSFWLDIAKGLAIVLLTNRVLMGDDPSPIRRLRPLLHDTIMKYLTKDEDPIEQN